MLKRIGCLSSLPASSLSDHRTLLAALHPPAGSRPPLLITPEKDIYTRLDVAYTHEGRSVYFFIGEAF